MDVSQGSGSAMESDTEPEQEASDDNVPWYQSEVTEDEAYDKEVDEYDFFPIYDDEGGDCSDESSEKEDRDNESGREDDGGQNWSDNVGQPNNVDNGNPVAEAVPNTTQLPADNVVEGSVDKDESAVPWAPVNVEFYHAYGRAKGFSTRLGQVKYDKSGKEIWRAIYCHREGSRDRKYVELVNRSRKAQRLTRFGCKARISVRYDRTRGFFRFGTFVEEHNHELALDTFVPYFRACRRVTQADLDTVMAMRDCNIRISEALDFMITNRGGYWYLGFLSKDMYNRADAENRLRSIGGDAQTMIDYMHDKKREDPGHKCFFSTDKQGRLASIIWRDSTSLCNQYLCSLKHVFSLV